MSAGTPRDAPSSNDASPSGTAFSTGTTVYSAAVPHGLCQPARYTHTRSPFQAFATPSPTASITPAPSCPGTWKSKLSGPVAPARAFQSVGFTPATASRTSTSPGPGCGVSTSPTSSTPEPPVSA